MTPLFHDYFDFNAHTRPDDACLEDHARTLTAGAALAEALKLASGLFDLGLRPGDRFGYLAKNSCDIWLMYQAAARTGIVPVPLNYRLVAPEWQYILADSGAKAVIAQAPYLDALESIMGDLPALKTIVGIDAPPRPGVIDYRPWLASQKPLPPKVEVGPEDILYQMYTSGTTGRPKGVLVRHANYASNIAQAVSMYRRRPEAGSTALIVPPLYHAGAVWISAFSTMMGMSLDIQADFSPHAVVDVFEKKEIGYVFLVPAMIQACLTQVPDIERRDMSKVRIMIYGASPIAEETLRRAMQIFTRCDIYQAYGLTETTAVLTVLQPEDHRRALAGEPELLQAAGRPLPGTDLRIVDADGRDVAPGEVGEIVAKGPQIVPGYWNLPEANASFIRDGYAHTGDAGVLDDEGFLYIRDRIKDMVVSGGENIYPREVENVLFEHPGIADAAVIGVPDEKYGEALLAIVVPRPGAALDEAEVVAFCRTQLGGYKVPRKIRIAEALPRNASGKILKTELRAPYWQGKRRGVS